MFSSDCDSLTRNFGASWLRLTALRMNIRGRHMRYFTTVIYSYPDAKKVLILRQTIEEFGTLII